ncbi:universal stress protein A-like protein isoform X1 [Vigna radiata var. radiata]|uniref:Universal stress protein A-like protein isoform X1 n=1 Tax=Vigna radiata var. radiata TaxID=3916 RepID=A0A1S3UC16_VIGRR|nr:universal stress protein A-like protein isoform X1 [Vigna radiata var. radiata]
MDKREANKKETTAKAEMSGSGNLNRVLVSVDGSEESMKALRWALNNLKLRSPTSDSIDAPSFIIFHVQSPPSIATGLNPGAIPFGGPSDIEVPAFTAAIEAHQERITRAVLDHALGICSQFNLGMQSQVRTHVVVGDPKEKICEAVQDLHADVLVMGSRAFGPIKRMFLGSVSNYCAHHAPCPVIIIKENDSVNKIN